MHVFDLIIEGDLPFDALVAELAPGQSLQELFEEIYKTYDYQARMRASVIFVRPPVKWEISPTELELIRNKPGVQSSSAACRFLKEALSSPRDTFARVMDKPIYILASNRHEIYISENINQWAAYSPLYEGGRTTKAVLASIQDREIDYIVEAGRAKLPHSPGVYYRAPSKRAMRSFFRVGNIQRSRAALDAIFFWLLPNLKTCAGIVTDTWSISSISMNVSRRLCSYAGGNSAPCPVEMLSHYHDGSPARATEAAEIIERLISRAGIKEPTKGQVVFLISATHTGSLAHSLKEVLREREIPEGLVKFIALFKLGAASSEIHALRDLSTGPDSEDFRPVTDDELQSRIETIEIDEQVYFPLQYRDIFYEVRAKQTKGLKDFLGRYQDRNLIRVHKTATSNNPPRHNAVWVDTSILIQHHEFQRRLEEAIHHLEPCPDLIIVPGHEAAMLLADIALRTIKKRNDKAQVIAHPNLFLPDSPNANDIKAANAVDSLSSDKSILILDDAFISGERLTGYQRHLRSRTFSGRIHYLVALARPESIKEWEYRSRMLCFRQSGDPKKKGEQNTVTAIETIILPHWGENECPWCQEIGIYRQIETKLRASLSSAVLRDRLEFLMRSKNAGLVDDLFLSVEGHPSLEITKGSIFLDAPASQAATFAAVAGAIQVLRSQEAVNRPVLGPRRFPVSTILNDEEYLESIYTDSVLRAAFLRAGQIDELVPTGRDANSRRTSRAEHLILSEDISDSNLTPEILYAAAAGKLPNLNVKNIDIQSKISSVNLYDLIAFLTSYR